MIWTPVDGAGPAGQFHATEAVNWLRSTNGAGVVGHTFSVSVATMTVTLPAFNCYVPNGSGVLIYVAYAGGTVVIAASDPTNPRTSIIQINSSGTVSEKAGTATAETGDVVEAPMAAIDSDAIAVLKVRVGAAVTTLSDSVMKGRAIDISDASGWRLVGVNTAEATMTSATEADLVTITGLSIPAAAPVMIVVNFRKSATIAQPSIGLKINSTVVLNASAAAASGIGSFSVENEAENGESVVFLAPRRTNYDRGLSGHYATSGPSNGQRAVVPLGVSALQAAIPIATITDVIIRGDSDGTNTLGVQGVYVYALGI